MTPEQLRQIMPRAPAEFVEPLNATFIEFGIEPGHQPMFLAQMAHESVELTKLTENLNYSAQGLLRVFRKRFTPDEATDYARHPERIANRVYANRMGNGSEASGDGWRYRGRGAGITGRLNYARCGEALGVDLITDPDLLEEPEYVCRSFGWFWRANNCGLYADDIVACSGIVNAGTPRIAASKINGLEDRERYFELAKEALA